MPRNTPEYLRISMALSDLEDLEKRFLGVPLAETEILNLVKKAKEYLEDRKVIIQPYNHARKDGVPR